ncbi:hypothetical protein RQN30_12275 [Arcanobacterium hippocoleae]
MAAGYRTLFSYTAGYFLVSAAIFQSIQPTLIMTVCAAVIELISAYLLKSWKPGLSDEEVRQKWVETKEMTKRIMAEHPENDGK